MRKMIAGVFLTVLAGGCYHLGAQGFAAQNTDWKTGGTVLYGIRRCNARNETPCHRLWGTQDPAKDEAARKAAWDEAETELSKTLAGRCAGGWTVVLRIPSSETGGLPEVDTVTTVVGVKSPAL